MREEYDFENMKGHKNPFANKLKRQITIRLTEDAINYFKQLSKESGITYQNLINIYLTDCAIKRKKIKISWQ